MHELFRLNVGICTNKNHACSKHEEDFYAFYTMLQIAKNATVGTRMELSDQHQTVHLAIPRNAYVIFHVLETLSRYVAELMLIRFINVLYSFGIVICRYVLMVF